MQNAEAAPDVSSSAHAHVGPLRHPRLTLQVVVVGVLGHPAVEERPRQVVHSVLLVLHSFGDNLGIEVVVEAVVQMGLHRQWLIQELLEEVLEGKEEGRVWSVPPRSPGLGQLKQPWLPSSSPGT